MCPACGNRRVTVVFEPPASCWSWRLAQSLGFIGGQLLGFVPTPVLLPLLTLILVLSALKVWRHQ